MLAEVKQSLEDLQRDWSEFKKTNDQRLKLVEEKGHAPADFDEKMDKINSSMDKLTADVEQLKATANQPSAEDQKAEQKEIQAKHREAIRKWFQKGGRGENISDEHLEAMKKGFEAHENDGMKLLAVNVDRDGGIWVRPEFDMEIRKKVFETSPMRELADQQTISTDSLEFPYDDDEPDSGWVGETESRPETENSQMNEVSIFAHEIYAQPKATQKLLDDSAIDIEAWHAGKVADRFMRQENTAFVSGNGNKKPKGFLSYPAGDGFGSIEQVASGSAGGVTADGLIDLQNSLIENFQPNARWLMKRATAAEVRKLKDGEDRYLWSVSGDLATGVMQSLLGKPVRFANDMPDVAADALSIAYGDFRQGYLIVDRIGIRILRDPYTQKGKVLFYTTKRVGGGVQHFQAIKLQKLAVSV